MTANFCSNCGKGVTKEDKFCPECGDSLVLETLASEIPSDLDIGKPQPQYVQQVRPDFKDPFTAALSSLIIVGVGQFYVGKWWRGLGFMALAILFFWASIPIFGLGVIVIWILAPIDAHNQATKHNIKYGYSKEEHVEKGAYLRR